MDRLTQKAAQEPTAENYLALGVSQLKAEKYEEAVKSFKQSVKLDPSSSQAHHNLGVAYVRLGRNREALDEFRLSNRIEPEYQKLLIPISPPGGPNETRTLEELRQAAAADSRDIHAAFALAQGFHRAELLEEAVGQYGWVVSRSPRHAGAHYGLGSSYAQLGRYEDAIGSLKEAVHLKPSWAAPHYTLGLVHLLQGDVEKAFREYQVLRQIDARLADNLFAKIYE
jgi:tetratricopeptide (TPR) repeat protein